MSSRQLSTRDSMESLRVRLPLHLPPPGSASAAAAARRPAAPAHSTEAIIRVDASPALLAPPAPPRADSPSTPAPATGSGGGGGGSGSGDYSGSGSTQQRGVARGWLSGLVARLRGVASDPLGRSSSGVSHSSSPRTPVCSSPQSSPRRLSMKRRRGRSQPTTPGDGAQASRRCASFVLEHCVCPITQVCWKLLPSNPSKRLFPFSLSAVQRSNPSTRHRGSSQRALNAIHM